MARLAARRYARSHLVWDALSIFPFEEALSAGAPGDARTYNTKLLRVLRLARLGKLLRVLRMSRIMQRLQDHLNMRYGCVAAARRLCVRTRILTRRAHRHCSAA
jgi:hypothetical protein